MTTTTPRWALADALRRARIAYRLAVKHRALIERRLEAGEIEDLASHRAALGDASDAGPLGAQKLATVAERELADDAHDLVVSIRNAVRRSKNSSAALRAALGIGDGLRPGDTAGIVRALDAIVGQAAALRACRVTADDITEAGTLREALRGADRAQSDKKDERADATETRLDTQLELEAEIDAIHVAGVLAFRKDAVARARFERLVAASGPTEEDDPGPPAAPATPVTPA